MCFKPLQQWYHADIAHLWCAKIITTRHHDIFCQYCMVSFNQKTQILLNIKNEIQNTKLKKLTVRVDHTQPPMTTQLFLWLGKLLYQRGCTVKWSYFHVPMDSSSVGNYFQDQIGSQGWSLITPTTKFHYFYDWENYHTREVWSCKYFSPYFSLHKTQKWTIKLCVYMIYVTPL